MEIVVKRIAKMKTYTIGHLYLLKDEEVESRQSFRKEWWISVSSAALLIRRNWMLTIISATRWSLLGAIFWASL